MYAHLCIVLPKCYYQFLEWPFWVAKRYKKWAQNLRCTSSTYFKKGNFEVSLNACYRHKIKDLELKTFLTMKNWFFEKDTVVPTLKFRTWAFLDDIKLITKVENSEKSCPIAIVHWSYKWTNNLLFPFQKRNFVCDWSS